MMKSFKSHLIVLSIFGMAFTSCDRDNSRLDDLNTVSEEEAIELVQESLISDVYGTGIQAEDATALENDESSKSVYECGVMNERNFNRNSTNGASVSFDHEVDYTFRLICENNEPKTYAIDFASEGTYTAPRMDSNDTIDYEAFLTNIRDAEGPFIYTGNFTRRGTQTTRIAGNDKNFNSVLTIETAVTIDKQTRIVLDGSSTFSLTGTTGSGNTFSYQGDVSYLGNGAATIVVNGNTYNVSL